MAAPLQELSQQYEQLAWGCYLTSTSLVTGINMLLDIALIAAINALIVATTSWFNPEAAVSAALLIACLEMITADWMTMLTIITGTEAACFALASRRPGLPPAR